MVRNPWTPAQSPYLHFLSPIRSVCLLIKQWKYWSKTPPRARPTPILQQLQPVLLPLLLVSVEKCHCFQPFDLSSAPFSTQTAFPNSHLASNLTGKRSQGNSSKSSVNYNFAAIAANLAASRRYHHPTSVQ